MSLRNEKGFSLIELAIVVLVAGIVLAFTTPSINRFLVQARLRDAASRVSGEMRLARQKAVTNSSRTWFLPANNSNVYWMGEQRWTGGNVENASSFATTTWKGPYTLPSTVRIIQANWGGLTYFWYAPNGRPVASGSMKLVSTVGAPDTLTVNVDLSGSVWR
jgi:prepilin-type N-terminal cleavage/methylation domain-containing protein